MMVWMNVNNVTVDGVPVADATEAFADWCKGGKHVVRSCYGWEKREQLEHPVDWPDAYAYWQVTVTGYKGQEQALTCFAATAADAVAKCGAGMNTTYVGVSMLAGAKTLP